MLLQGVALLVSLLEADAGSTGFISVSNGAFVDGNCTEFIPVGWNSCASSAPLLVALLGVNHTLYCLIARCTLPLSLLQSNIIPFVSLLARLQQVDRRLHELPHRHHDMRALGSLAF